MFSDVLKKTVILKTVNEMIKEKLSPESDKNTEVFRKLRIASKFKPHISKRIKMLNKLERVSNLLWLRQV